MYKQTEAQIHVLDRVLYLLEERSVGAVADHDMAFRNYLEDIYASISQKATSLK